MAQDAVIARDVTVDLQDGLHLRPMSQIARRAAEYECDITIDNGTKTVNAKSALDLMSLKAEYRDTLTVQTKGPDAEAAMDAMMKLFESNFEIEDGNEQ